MKIDREYFETYTWNFGKQEGQKYYKFEKIAENVGAYIGAIGETWFELDTLENIGWIDESDNRTNWRSYFNATCIYGWDGSRKTQKEFKVKLCTRADYNTAKNLMLSEYRRRK